jgi:hypothetical protein
MFDSFPCYLWGAAPGDKNWLTHSLTRLEPQEGEFNFLPKSLERCEGGMSFWTKSQGGYTILEFIAFL